MRFARTYIFSFLAWVVCSVPAFAQEVEDRIEINREVDRMLQQNDFAGLEAMAVEFRDSDERTSSGLQKLNLYYFGIDASVKQQLRYLTSWETISGRADAWVEAYPTSPTAAISKAIMLSRHAWHIRGGGYQKSVGPNDWEPFYYWLAQADAVLVDAKDYAAVDPFWYTHRANILTQQGVDPEVFVPFVREGFERHPTFYQLYFSAVDYLTPKWYGDAGKIEAFANDAVEYTQSLEGSGLYARIYWYASQTQYDVYLFTESDVVWAKMRRGISDVLAQYPDQWNIQNFALFACIADDVEMTRSLLDKMDGPPIMAAWRNNEILDYCRALANAR